MSDSWWSCYEQLVVIVSLFLAISTSGLAFRLSKLPWGKRFIVSLTWDFSRSWATNVSSLTGIVGVALVSAVTTDFKPFSQASVKGSYVLATLLMGAIVLAAPSIYTLLQKKQNNQMVGSVGGFIVASLFTIWGTTAQLFLQGALLIAFVLQRPGSRFALLLLPLTLFVGLVLLFPYSIRSILVALATETGAPSAPLKTLEQLNLNVQLDQDESAKAAIIVAQLPRKLAIL